MPDQPSRPNLNVLIDPSILIRALADPGTNHLDLLCVEGVGTTDPSAIFDFVRSFHHTDWIDGESLVQAGKTPDEAGFNDRFHAIERDLDALGANVQRAIAAIVTLRAQVRLCLNEIVSVVNQKDKDNKEKEDSKDSKDSKDGTDAKNDKDNKETKDNKDHKDSPDNKDDRDTKHDKDISDKDKEHGKDVLGAAEKRTGSHELPLRDGSPDVPAYLFGPPSDRPMGARVFIRPEERPVLGERALNAPREE